MPSQVFEPRRVLFLCSGNYYRSRFAEILFNHLAAGEELPWEAISRGLAADRENNNEGPISAHAVRGLLARGVPLPEPARYPLQLEQRDLEASGLTVAIKETEHRPMLEQRYPGWSERVEYWHIDDLDRAGPEEALAEIERQVRALLARLGEG